jgi:serine/threonine-protein kinase RsbT
MSVAYDRVLAVLEKYVSRVTARALLDQSLHHSGIRREELADQQLVRVLRRITGGVQVFVKPADQPSLRRDLSALEPAPEYVPPDLVTIGHERDISTARNLARGMCERMGAPSLAMQKVATIVSELARNIVSYASNGSGSVELIPSTTPRPRIVIRAVDKGPGISRLEDILAGRYQSRTGLGKGIVGTKRLADRFDIQTGPAGTRVEAEVLL